MSLTYTNYLKIDDLLNLQKPQSDPEEHDEMLFIIIHQTYELWFKQILHEFDLLRTELNNGETWTAIKTMSRILTIMKTLVGQVDILETMTPLEFNSFRGFLESASGFQSVQFRELELLCGLRSEHIMEIHKSNPTHTQRLQNRLDEQTIWEAFCRYLIKTGYEIDMPQRVHANGLMFEPSKQIQQVLIKIMRKGEESALLCERLVDFDEGLQEWRYRHVKMVQRTIGTKKGTGGSDGVEYLSETLHKPVFPDLWAIRTQF